MNAPHRPSKYFLQILASLAASLGITLGVAPAAHALIPVVPFITQDQIQLATGSLNTSVTGQDTSLSLTSPNGLATGSITLASTGRPDLSVGVTLTPGSLTQAEATYINTITFRYTGTGPAPAQLSSHLSWTVNATMPGSSAATGDFGGNASLAISLSTCYCPLQGVYDSFSQTGSQTLTDPFTIANGGTIAYETTLGAYATGTSGLSGSVALDPQLMLTLPNGWTGTLGSGGSLEGSLANTPEPSSLWLFATGMLPLLFGRRLRYAPVREERTTP